MKYRVKHVFEYVGLRMIVGVIRALPYRASLFVGCMNAWLAFYVFGFRVKDAKRRIKMVFGDRFSDQETGKLAWMSWRNFVFSIVETIRLDKMTKDWVESVYSDEHVIEKLTKHAKTGRGAIIATFHMGSWEMAAVRIHLHGIPVFSIAARQKNPLVDAYLNRLRRAPGIDTVARGAGTMKEVLKKIKAGGFLAILPDVRIRKKDILVPFLGGEANVGAGMARFARQTNVPILPSVLSRKGWSRHEAVVHEPIIPDKNLDKNEDVKRMTLAVFKIIEEAIRQDPGQWFWFNKRWILDPVEGKAEGGNLSRAQRDGPTNVGNGAKRSGKPEGGERRHD